MRLEDVQWAAVVKPGEVLVISFERLLTMQDADTLMRRFEDRGVRVAIVSGAASMAVKLAAQPVDNGEVPT